MTSFDSPAPASERVVVSVDTFKQVLRDAEVTGGVPTVHSALHRPGDRRAAQILPGAMLDARKFERALPDSPDMTDTIAAKIHHVVGALAFPWAQVREQFCQQRDRRLPLLGLGHARTAAVHDAAPAVDPAPARMPLKPQVQDRRRARAGVHGNQNEPRKVGGILEVRCGSTAFSPHAEYEATETRGQSAKRREQTRLLTRRRTCKRNPFARGQRFPMTGHDADRNQRSHRDDAPECPGTSREGPAGREAESRTYSARSATRSGPGSSCSCSISARPPDHSSSSRSCSEENPK